MSVRKKITKSGIRYVVDFYVSGRKGPRYKQTLPAGTTEAGARTIELNLREQRDPENSIAIASGSTVKDAFPTYLEWYELHHRPNTVIDVKSAYKMHLKPHLGQYRVEDIGRGHVEAYQKMRRTENIVKHGRQAADAQGAKRDPLKLTSDRTINKELAYFSGFLKWCRRQGMHTKNIEIENLPYKRPLPIILTIEEIGRIIQVAPPMYKALYLCLYGPGLRLQEALKLRPIDIDYESRRARVEQKGGKQIVVPLPELAIEFLMNIEPGDKNGYYFPSRKKEDGIIRPIGDIRRPLARDVKQAKIMKKVTPHLFRHSIATHMVASGVNLRVIQKLLGHAQVSTTEWYTQVDIANVQDAVDQISVGLPESIRDYERPKYKHGVTKSRTTASKR